MHWKALLISAALATTACTGPAIAAEDVFEAPVATRQANERGLQTAILAGGCFWGIEAVFSHTRGVTSVISGYHGGSADDATYSRVSSGRTGHAESVKITYDPTVIRYDQLLQILFSVGADPTLLNRQGPDHGTQYRAAIVPTTPEQRAVATAYVRQMNQSGVWDDPIVVQVEREQRFYPAEAYHQDFADKNPNNAYIQRWDAPKVEALEENFPNFYRASFRKG